MALLNAVLRAYAQVLFSQDRRVGALLLATTLSAPRVGLAGLAATLLSLAVARLMRLSPEAIARGATGVNALLLGLALGAAYEPGPTLAVLLVLGVVAVVPAQAALEAGLAALAGLPALSLPFALTTLVARLAAQGAPGLSAALPGFPGPGLLDRYLESLGAIVFLPDARAGLGVLAALLVFSRIGTVLSLVGFAAAQAVALTLAPGDAATQVALGFNGVLAAVALGGLWFVPQPSALGFAGLAAAVSSLLGLALAHLLGPLHLPALVLPSGLTVLLGLYAMRQRVRDGAPKAVDFLPGTPEVNLAHHRAWAARFGARLWVRLALPFSGRWTVTQGVGGKHTHRGPWRDALDFEVLDEAGSNHAGSGAALADYHCYRLPVLAPADGQVVKVVRDVADNPVGRTNPEDNWGNLVLLRHGPGLHSLVCHLAPGTPCVVEGQWVRQGDRLGLCGNSGRSLVPHLHLQLQSEPRVGAPTLELELHDLILESRDGPRQLRASVPVEGDRVRNPERGDEAAALLDLPLGRRLTFSVTGPDGRSRRERAEVGLDLLGRAHLAVGEARLSFERQARQHLGLEAHAPPGSVPWLLFAAAPRVPFDPAPGLAWEDVLPRRLLLPPALGWLLDAVEPFLPGRGVRMSYRAERRGDALVITGRSAPGGPAVETEARFDPLAGPAELSVRLGGAAWRAVLEEVDHGRAGEPTGAPAAPGRAA